MMYKARAVGGPLDGIKLTSPLSWDGKIPIRGFNYRYHPGRYVPNQQKGIWKWVTDSEGREGQSVTQSAVLRPG